MKTKIFKFFMVFAATSTLVLTSCKDDDGAGPTCSDGIQNGTETGIDCGGTCGNVCEAEPTCTDGIMNGDETGVDCGGSCDPCSESVNLTSESPITEDMTLDPNNTYTLDGQVSIESGATLTIPAGTIITAAAATGDETETYIVVQKGGKIDIQGTSSEPVIMTSNNETPGDWGGLVIAGDATTTKGVDATAE
ncbi:hypothetical protein BUL40_10800, partial [Croceivirga radicis]